MGNQGNRNVGFPCVLDYGSATTGLFSFLSNGFSSSATYSYDPNGNTTQKKNSSGTTSYEYNLKSQLVKVTKPNNDTITFTYDAENRRVSKTVNGVTTNYVYDGENLAQETDASGTVLATYTYDDKGSPVRMVKGTSSYYFEYNGQGDVIALTDSTGAVAATYKYDPWGNITEKTGSLDTPFGYRGKYGYTYDKETGLYFLKSRYYDPETGRFTQKDRFAGFEDEPASQHPYIYCENDPVNKVDPDGTSDWKTTTLMVLGGIGLGAAAVALLPEEIVGGTVIGIAEGVTYLVAGASAGVHIKQRTDGDIDNRELAGGLFLDSTSFIPGGEWGLPKLGTSIISWGLSVGDYRNANMIIRSDYLNTERYRRMASRSRFAGYITYIPPYLLPYLQRLGYMHSINSKPEIHIPAWNPTMAPTFGLSEENAKVEEERLKLPGPYINPYPDLPRPQPSQEHWREIVLNAPDYNKVVQEGNKGADEMIENILKSHGYYGSPSNK